ncbi:MAG: hypothetical protein ACYTGQ_00540, partial [Planctomycetota bacterium]
MSFNVTNIFKQTETTKVNPIAAAKGVDAGAGTEEGFEGVFRQATQAVEQETPRTNARQEAADPEAPAAETSGAEPADPQADASDPQDAVNRTDPNEATDASQGDEATPGEDGSTTGDPDAQATKEDAANTDPAEASAEAVPLTPAALNNPILQNALTGASATNTEGASDTAGQAGNANTTAQVQQAPTDAGQQQNGQPEADQREAAQTLNAALEIADELAATDVLDEPTDDIDTLTLNQAAPLDAAANTQANTEAGADTFAPAIAGGAQSQSGASSDQGAANPGRQAAVELQAASNSGVAGESSFEVATQPVKSADASTASSAKGPTVEGRVVIETEASVARTPVVETTAQTQAVSATGQAASANLIEDAPDEDNHRVTQQAIRAVRSVI